MTENPLFKKMKLKPGQRAAIIHAPGGYAETLQPLPADVELAEDLAGMFDWVQLFVKTQAELEEKTVEVKGAGGKVTVVANGAGDVLSIKIAKEIVDPEDVEILEDLILSGVQQAIAQGKEMAGSEMSKLTGGMNLPGLGGLGI